MELKKQTLFTLNRYLKPGLKAMLSTFLRLEYFFHQTPPPVA